MLLFVFFLPLAFYKLFVLVYVKGQSLNLCIAALLLVLAQACVS